MEARTPGAKRADEGEHLFDLRTVNRLMGGPAYSPVFGGCVEGERMIVALMRYPAGQPSEAHSHPNEQWIYVLEGELEMQLDGEWLRGRPGQVFTFRRTRCTARATKARRTACSSRARTPRTACTAARPSVPATS